MKKQILLSVFAFLALASVSCSNNDDEQNGPSLRVLTFEDVDYKGSGNFLGSKDWSSLIDDVERKEDGLIYGVYNPTTWSFGDVDYSWYDEGNTLLAHEFEAGKYGAKNYTAGGHALSNFVETDIKECGYERELSIPVKDETTGNGGYAASKNFCMYHGYVDSAENYSTLPNLYFKDNVARVVDHMYVVCSSYMANMASIGNEFSPALAEGESLKVIAIGYNGAEKVGELTFELANSSDYVSEWTKWDLSSLGKITNLRFNIDGPKNEYGLMHPAYFAYDNVAVQF